MKYTIESFNARVKELWNNQFEILDMDKPFEGVHYKRLVRCNKCGNEYEKRANDLLHGYGCSFCKGLGRKDNKYYKEKM